MDERDITLVAAAFDRLMASLAHKCDKATCWTIAGAKDDVIDILSGDWHGDTEPCITSDDDEGGEYDQRDEDADGYAAAVAEGLERWTR